MQVANTTPRLDEKPQALATERISAAQSGALAQIPLTPGLLMRPFSVYSGNETLFPSEK